MKCRKVCLVACTVALLPMVPTGLAQEVGPPPRTDDGERVGPADQHGPTIKDAYKNHFLIGTAGDLPGRYSDEELAWNGVRPGLGNKAVVRCIP